MFGSTRIAAARVMGISVYVFTGYAHVWFKVIGYTAPSRFFWQDSYECFTSVLDRGKIDVSIFTY